MNILNFAIGYAVGISASLLFLRFVCFPLVECWDKFRDAREANKR